MNFQIAKFARAAITAYLFEEHSLFKHNCLGAERDSLLLTYWMIIFVRLCSLIKAAVMPVHRDREKKDTTAEEMEVDEQDQEAYSSDEEDLDTSSVSEDGDSSGEEL